jgi:tRNA1(Val) A37 N6-methylase TrmN6
MSVIQGDLRQPPLTPFSADVVVCNPPYRQTATGRINPDLQRAIARHELMASLDDILGTSRRLLRTGGRLAVIYAAVRLVDLLIRMRGFGLEPKRIQLVHPAPDAEAKLVLVEAAAEGRRGARILPPLMEQSRTPL